MSENDLYLPLQILSMTYVFKVPEYQMDKLYEIKDATGTSISKHIKTALDEYLKRFEPGGDLYHKIRDSGCKER